MINHTQNGAKHEVTPLTEKAARFLNSFVGRSIVMTEKEFRSMAMEMSVHGCWIREA